LPRALCFKFELGLQVVLDRVTFIEGPIFYISSEVGRLQIATNLHYLKNLPFKIYLDLQTSDSLQL